VLRKNSNLFFPLLLLSPRLTIFFNMLLCNNNLRNSKSA
jgi:hypothetical protein